MKAYASLISQPLSCIYNYSLHTGIFPDHLKISIVKPLFKKGDKISMTNYRPSSLVMFFFLKYWKRLCTTGYTKIVLVLKQFGFRQGSSTENAAFKLTDSVFKSINQKMHVGGIFCGLAKAFDCINHKILLTKLNYYGVQGTVANWFRSHLTENKKPK
jgi:hypothetical protein